MSAADMLDQIEAHVSDTSPWVSKHDVCELVAALRAVLDLHHETVEWVAPGGDAYYSGCAQGCADDEGFSDYPCPTVRAIEEALS